jgi:hypothetical protein
VKASVRWPRVSVKSADCKTGEVYEGTRHRRQQEELHL